MTIIAQHLRCDMREKCVSCTKCMISPKEEKRYFYCPGCKSDILCDRGLIQKFGEDRDGMIQKQNLCMKCNSEVEERMWPEDTERI